MGTDDDTTSTQDNNEEAVRLRAYYLYVERTHNDLGGDELHDWLQAEQEISSDKMSGS